MLITCSLIGCGSSGGGSAGGGDSYDSGGIGSRSQFQGLDLYSGMTTHANITPNNALKVFLYFWSGGPTTAVASSTSSSMTVTNSINSTAYSLKGNTINSGLVNSTSTTQIQETYYGKVSGTANHSGYINDDGTGKVTVLFDNFNDGDGIIYDGDQTTIVHSYDIAQRIITSMDIEITSLTTKSDAGYSTVSGLIYVDVNLSGNTETQIINLDGRNELSEETFRLDNLIIETNFDSLFYPKVCNEKVSGRLYVQTEGFVDINQENPFVYNYYNQYNINLPDSGGPLFMHGTSGSKEQITPLSLNKLQIEVDKDGDDIYETSKTYNWNQLVNVVFTWEKTFSFSESVYNSAKSIQETSDGGYIVVGNTNTSSPDRMNYYLIKTDAAGEVEWEKTFGGTNDDYASSVKQTPDGGFIVAGYSEPFPSTMHKDIYLVKTDSSGNLEWEKTFDAIYPESWSNSMQVTSDGGLILAGAVRTEQLLWTRYSYLAKMDSSGNIIWDKILGGSRNDEWKSVAETSDGGYIVVGITENLTFRDEDIYIMKTDSVGNIIWDKLLSEDGRAFANDIKETLDGGYIIAGSLAYDDYLFKTDNDGNITWEKIWEDVSFYDVQTTSDGGYILTGKIDRDLAFRKVDSNGVIEWDKTYNWTNYQTYCQGSAVQTTSDGGFIAAGATSGFQGNHFYLIKTDSDGNI